MSSVPYFNQLTLNLILTLVVSYADELRKLCKEYHNVIAKLESDKYDLEYQVKRIDYDIHELSMKVNDMRGKL